VTTEEQLELMVRHVAAWNAHDIDELLELMTPDCIFDAAAGPYPYGQRHVGHQTLRMAFSAIFKAFPDARWTDPEHSAAADRGFTVWTFRGTGVDGRQVEVRGLDILHFRDTRICSKDTFRKNVISL
jgi:ketosteroid isomerase-like protein